MDWQQPPKNLAISSQEIHVWRANLDLASEQIADLTQTLSPDEIDRANRFRFPIHKNRFIAARGRLRQILGRYLQIAPQEVEFAYSDRGKPFLKQQQLQFNVSHTEDIALYAFTPQQVIGIDLEYLGKETEYKQIAQRFFTPAEAELINNAKPPDCKRLFYHLWTVKEAYLKAIGSGLVGGLDNLEVEVANLNCRDLELQNSPEIKIVKIDDPSVKEEDWSCHNLVMPSQFIATLVVKSDRQSLTIRQFFLNHYLHS